ncbi:hypothetical protein BDK51DRAFT_28377 [Blyttiomyces helicus]|uniref:Acyltransferase 3 domain-containing protein n=1 Tax=Blyttiomyces helicus TaxID=388810 RepID=A0A4P9WBM0_9FUNG|nr:hypothetical protein BDK51DRAFT_28377 [Blyttiomyces helicus]|eukprot:RKO89662.1 hypothetical protein BDK51DRAFT_28377 [Blyttiomyces helicus]
MGRGWGPKYPIGVQWTLGIEFWQSYWVYLFAIVVSNAGPRRWVLYAIAISITFLQTTWTTPFFLGLLIADLAESGHIAALKKHPRWTIIHRSILAFTLLLHLAASDPLRLSGVKRFVSHFIWWMPEPVYSGAQGIWGSYDFAGVPFWHADPTVLLNAFTVVLAIELTPVLQRVFETRFMRFLGQISFMLYLIHPLIHATVGSAALLVTASHLPYPIAMVITYFIDLAVNFSLSYALTLYVDEPCVRFGRTAFNFCFKDPWGWPTASPASAVFKAPASLTGVVFAAPLKLVRMIGRKFMIVLAAGTLIYVAMLIL